MRVVTKWKRVTLPLSLALLAFGLQAHGEADPAGSTSTNRAANLGCDVVDGVSNKIARIFKVTPTHVHVIYEGGNSGRNIPRQELSEPLKSRFPYDSAKAAEHRQQRVAEAAAQEAARSAAVRATSLKREQEIVAEIARLEEADKQLQSSTRVDRNLPRGNERRTRITDQTNQRQQIRARINELEGQLKTLRAQRDGLP